MCSLWGKVLHWGHSCCVDSYCREYFIRWFIRKIWLPRKVFKKLLKLLCTSRRILIWKILYLKYSIYSPSSGSSRRIRRRRLSPILGLISSVLIKMVRKLAGKCLSSSKERSKSLGDKMKKLSKRSKKRIRMAPCPCTWATSLNWAILSWEAVLGRKT